MLKINGRRIFNLTGQEIKLAAGNNAYMTIPSDGIVEVYYRDERSRWADPVCRELGLPTDRLYTVGEAIHDGKNIEGYRSLVKH